jgi:hypothetical protein
MIHIEPFDRIGGRNAAFPIEDAWKFYERTFSEIEGLAAQRHLMHHSEFDEVMTDPRVRKYVACGDGGRLLGLSTITNTLESMPLISPTYFARRWPGQYAERAIWYVGFVGCEHGHHAFAPLVRRMILDANEASARPPMIVVDFCGFNVEHRRMPRVVEQISRGLDPGVRFECLDAQSFWSYRFTDELGNGRP